MKKSKEVLLGFSAILPKNPRILILGSMPSVSSLEKSEYYGFSHNRFWTIMAKFSNRNFANYDDKMKMLNDYNIALWDVIYSCERVGSLDSNIKNVTCNPIDVLVREHSSIQYIVCNGKKSYDLLIRYFPKLCPMVISLGSTSNANRSVCEEVLFEQWLTTLNNLLDRKNDVL